MICDYGCGNIGTFKKNGRSGTKWSCSDNIQHCPNMRAKARDKTKKSIQKSKADGSYQARIDKMLDNRNKIGDDGLTSFQKGTKKMVETRLKNNSFQSGAEKGAKTKTTTIDPNTGQTLAKLYGKKAYNTRISNIDQTTGKTIQETCIEKGIKTRHKIDPNTGLSNYDLGQIKAKKLKKYKNSNLYFGSSYEYKWLEEVEKYMGLDWVLENIQRGPVIKYKDPCDISKTRLYPADFIFENYLIEIKSSYIWALSPNARLRNIEKMDTALSLGYDVRLVLNFKEYIWKRDRYKFL